jgi:uncharacterized protein (UPF0261 family)
LSTKKIIFAERLVPKHKQRAAQLAKTLVQEARRIAVYIFQRLCRAAVLAHFFLQMDGDSAFDYQDKRLILRRFLQNHCFIL